MGHTQIGHLRPSGERRAHHKTKLMTLSAEVDKTIQSELFSIMLVFRLPIKQSHEHAYSEVKFWGPAAPFMVT